MLLGLDPATLSRSLGISAFARTTRLKIMANLEAATLAVAAGRPKSSSGRKLENSETLLHILQKLYTLQIGRATSELQSLMRISYAVFCLKKKNNHIEGSDK